MIDAATLPADGQLLDGRYRLDALLDTIAGRTLWRATDVQNQQTVSVQLWDTDASPAEGTLTAARLRQPEDAHPAFAAMEWSGRTREGAAYAVYASLAGRYLDSWLADHALGAADALEIAAELTGALRALHEGGQVHGLIGSNVLLMTSTDIFGDQSQLRIVDTGIESQPAVPHGSAVKAELARTGKLLELLAERVVKHEGAEAAAAMASFAELARRSQAAPDVQPIESMAALDDAVQALATALPGKSERVGVRKVVTTIDFASPATGTPSPVAGDGATAAPATADATARAASDDHAALALVLESIEEMPGTMAPHDVTDAMSSLLMPASSMPPGLPPDQLLPEFTTSSLALTPTAAGAPIAQPAAPSVPSRPKTGPVPSTAPTSAPPTARVVDGGPMVFIIVGLLLLLIAVFIFVLLPE